MGAHTGSYCSQLSPVKHDREWNFRLLCSDSVNRDPSSGFIYPRGERKL